MLFAAKRGRPKTKTTNTQQIQEITQHNTHKSIDADVLQSLFWLRKINDEQNESAKFYQRLRNQYHSSIESPGMNTGSMIIMDNRLCKARHYGCQTKDQSLFQMWNDIKLELNRVDRGCEELLHKVLIENKMKYELLNPTNFMRNNLMILQNGLDRITQYRMRNGLLRW